MLRSGRALSACATPAVARKCPRVLSGAAGRAGHRQGRRGAPTPLAPSRQPVDVAATSRQPQPSPAARSGGSAPASTVTSTPSSSASPSACVPGRVRRRSRAQQRSPGTRRLHNRVRGTLGAAQPPLVHAPGAPRRALGHSHARALVHVTDRHVGRASRPAARSRAQSPACALALQARPAPAAIP